MIHASPTEDGAGPIRTVPSDTFESFVIQSGFAIFAASLGKNSTDALFRTFEILQPGIRKSDITSVNALSAALDESFGAFSKSIKKLIIEKMCIELEITLDESAGSDFLVSIVRIREICLSNKLL